MYFAVLFVPAEASQCTHVLSCSSMNPHTLLCSLCLQTRRSMYTYFSAPQWTHTHFAVLLVPAIAPQCTHVLLCSSMNPHTLCCAPWACRSAVMHTRTIVLLNERTPTLLCSLCLQKCRNVRTKFTASQWTHTHFAVLLVPAEAPRHQRLWGGLLPPRQPGRCECVV